MTKPIPEMVERVSRAIEATGPRESVASVEPSWMAFLPQARAAIAAMREPTGNMGSAAGRKFCDLENHYGGQFPSFGVIDCYRAMIDEALK